MTVTRAGADFAGATAAVAGSTAEALALATHLARTLDMNPIDVPDRDRAAYHAAASMASNFLLTLEWAAQRVGDLDRAGARAARPRDRRQLARAGRRAAR